MQLWCYGNTQQSTCTGNHWRNLIHQPTQAKISPTDDQSQKCCAKSIHLSISVCGRQTKNFLYHKRQFHHLDTSETGIEGHTSSAAQNSWTFQGQQKTSTRNDSQQPQFRKFIQTAAKVFGSLSGLLTCWRDTGQLPTEERAWSQMQKWPHRKQTFPSFMMHNSIFMQFAIWVNLDV